LQNVIGEPVLRLAAARSDGRRVTSTASSGMHGAHRVHSDREYMQHGECDARGVTMTALVMHREE
jgi:hypothetical protein